MKAKSKYLAYTFLYEDANDLRCDFEMLTDELTGYVSLLSNYAKNHKDALIFISTLIYHLNPSLRKGNKITNEELNRLVEMTSKLKAKTQSVFDNFEHKRKTSYFVLPFGNEAYSIANILRSKCKHIVRLIARFEQQGNEVEQITHDISNLLSLYFYYLALSINQENNAQEIEFVSRHYNVK